MYTVPGRPVPGKRGNSKALRRKIDACDVITWRDDFGTLSNVLETNPTRINQFWWGLVCCSWSWITPCVETISKSTGSWGLVSFVLQVRFVWTTLINAPFRHVYFSKVVHSKSVCHGTSWLRQNHKIQWKGTQPILFEAQDWRKVRARTTLWMHEDKAEFQWFEVHYCKLTGQCNILISVDFLLEGVNI